MQPDGDKDDRANAVGATFCCGGAWAGGVFVVGGNSKSRCSIWESTTSSTAVVVILAPLCVLFAWDLCVLFAWESLRCDVYTESISSLQKPYSSTCGEQG